MEKFDPDKALAELEEGSFDVSDLDLSALSQEEAEEEFDPDKALAELKAQTPKETSLLEDIEGGLQATSDFVGEKAKDALSFTRATARGAVPILNQASAFVSAAVDPVTDSIADTIYGKDLNPKKESFSERYHRNLNTIREQEEYDLENRPVTTLVGEAAGTMFGLSKGAKVLGLAGKTGKLAKAGNIALDSAYILAREIDRGGLDSESMNKAGWGIGLTTFINVAGGPLVRTIKGAAKIGAKTLNYADNAILNSAVQKTANATKKHVSNYTQKHGDKALERVTKMLKIDDPEVAGNPVVLKEKLDLALSETGEKLNQIYDEVTLKFGRGNFDGDALFNKGVADLKSVVKSAAGEDAISPITKNLENYFYAGKNNSLSVTNVGELNGLLRDLDSGVIDLFEGVNISHSAKSRILKTTQKSLRNVLKRERADLLSGLRYQSRVGSELDSNVKAIKNLELELRQLHKEAGEALLDTAPGAEKATNAYFSNLIKQKENAMASLQKQVDAVRAKGITPEGAERAKEILDSGAGIIEANKYSLDIDTLSKDYYEMADFKSMIVDTAKEIGESAGGQVTNYIKQVITRSPAVALGAAIGGPKGAFSMFAAEETTRRAAKFFATQAGTTTDTVMRSQLQKFSRGLETLAKANLDPALKTLSINLAKTIDDKELLPDEQWAKIDSILSEVELTAMPLDRSTASFRDRIDTVMGLATEKSPALAQKLSEAVNNKEDLGPILDQLSKTPGLSKYFKAGEGWEGRVYDPQEKLRMQNRISTDYPLMTTAQKLKEKDKIESGLIPDWDNLPQREKIKLGPGDKGKGSY